MVEVEKWPLPALEIRDSNFNTHGHAWSIEMREKQRRLGKRVAGRDCNVLNIKLMNL